MTTLVGKEIDGRYRIVSLLGRGGMSEVYQAEHLLMNRQVAIKVVRLLEDGGGDENNLQRFQQEARLLGSLRHPNIVDVFDFVRADEHVYMVMEFLEGESLRTRLLESSRLPAKQSLRVFIQICDALQYAHEHGMIHRDLKPGNIMVSAGDNVRLLDFGVAKLLCPTERDYQVNTHDDFMLGSPPYLSPEQCQGLELDTRSDIYSLGCLMYETLTGVLPIIGRNSMETVQKHLRYTPKKFKMISSDLNIPAALELMTMKCLEKQRADRYQSAAELRNDLEALLAEKEPPIIQSQVKQSIAIDEGDSSAWYSAPGGRLSEIAERLEEIKSFAYSSFDTIDKNGDGFISEDELRSALMDDFIPWRQKAYISFLLRRINDVQSSYKEEWAPDHDGISRADIQEYFNLVKGELETSKKFN